jgi:hypothetical protein
MNITVHQFYDLIYINVIIFVIQIVSGKFLFDSNRTALLFAIKPSSLGTIFPSTEGRRYSAKWEGKFSWLSYSSNKDAEFC